MFEENTKVVSEIGKEYDYIIVGGGAAGCVLASRLSEDDDVTVLLVESGSDDAGLERTYVAARGGFDHLPEHDWKYLPVPQKHGFKGSKESRPVMSAGKCLGGGTTINSLMWMRGVPADFDLWEKMGCEGWGYKDVLPYFLKSENMVTKRLADNGYHAVGGPLTITEQEWVTPIAKAFVEACQELGYRKVDSNSADPFGVMFLQSNIKDGVRESTSRAFLRPAMHRKNLDIALNTDVTQVLFEGKSAVGVKVTRDEREINIRARKEVVLCAGAIQSPKLLMLSGIGPRAHLESLGIPVLHELPVGSVLTDHGVVVWPSYVVDKPISITNEVLNSEEAKQMWEQSRTGPLASSCSLEACFLLPQPDNPALGDCCIVLLSGPFIIVKPGDEMFNFNQETYSALYDLPEGTHGFTIIIFVSHPKSTGTLRLQSNDPNDPPLIDPNILADEADRESLMRGMKLALAMRKTKAFQDIGALLIQKGVLPGLNPGDEEQEDYLRLMAQTLNNTGYHFAATCKMGAEDDPNAVVDPKLRVRGIKNLRVCDSGVMPEQTSANLNAPTIMMAEKAADIIRGKSLPQADLEQAAAIYKKWANK